MLSLLLSRYVRVGMINARKLVSPAVDATDTGDDLVSDRRIRSSKRIQSVILSGAGTSI